MYMPLETLALSTIGLHVFCQNEINKCEGEADFVMIWYKVGYILQINYILELDHHKAQ